LHPELSSGELRELEQRSIQLGLDIGSRFGC
jgi:hypothetical protein